MKVNNYPLKTPSAGDKLFGSDSNGDQKQFDMSNFGTSTYKVYVALLTQTGTNNPIVTVLENTLGQVNVVRNTAGNYSFVSNGLFLQNKTTINHKSVVSDDANYVMISYISSVNSIDFTTYDTFVQSDNILSYPLSVEIRVYN